MQSSPLNQKRCYRSKKLNIGNFFPQISIF